MLHFGEISASPVLIYAQHAAAPAEALLAGSQRYCSPNREFQVIHVETRGTKTENLQIGSTSLAASEDEGSNKRADKGGDENIAIVIHG